MRAALQDLVTERADDRPSGRVVPVAALGTQPPGAGHDRLAARLELGSTAAAGDEDAHRVHQSSPASPASSCGELRLQRKLRSPEKSWPLWGFSLFPFLSPGSSEE